MYKYKASVNILYLLYMKRKKLLQQKSIEDEKRPTEASRKRKSLSIAKQRLIIPNINYYISANYLKITPEIAAQNFSFPALKYISI